MKKSVSILGTNYSIKKVKHGCDEYMERMKFGGYCDGVLKEIVILDVKTIPDPYWTNASAEFIERVERETLRHEVVHAFLNESGLKHNAVANEEAWAKNEEMVDWIAIQFPKILEVFKKLGCVEG